jgi:hypothetical protein
MQALYKKSSSTWATSSNIRRKTLPAKRIGDALRENIERNELYALYDATRITLIHAIVKTKARVRAWTRLPGTFRALAGCAWLCHKFPSG